MIWGPKLETLIERMQFERVVGQEYSKMWKEEPISNHWQFFKDNNDQLRFKSNVRCVASMFIEKKRQGNKQTNVPLSTVFSLYFASSFFSELDNTEAATGSVL